MNKNNKFDWIAGRMSGLDAGAASHERRLHGHAGRIAVAEEKIGSLEELSRPLDPELRDAGKEILDRLAAIEGTVLGYEGNFQRHWQRMDEMGTMVSHHNKDWSNHTNLIGGLRLHHDQLRQYHNQLSKQIDQRTAAAINQNRRISELEGASPESSPYLDKEFREATLAELRRLARAVNDLEESSASRMKTIDGLREDIHELKRLADGAGPPTYCAVPCPPSKENPVSWELVNKKSFDEKRAKDMQLLAKCIKERWIPLSEWNKGSNECCLCEEYYEEEGVGCEKCPIRRKTGLDQCRGTPHGAWHTASFRHDLDHVRTTERAHDMLDFLRDLLVELVLKEEIS